MSKNVETLREGDKIEGTFVGRTETWTFVRINPSGMIVVRRLGEEMICNPMTFGYALRSETMKRKGIEAECESCGAGIRKGETLCAFCKQMLAIMKKGN